MNNIQSLLAQVTTDLGLEFQKLNKFLKKSNILYSPPSSLYLEVRLGNSTAINITTCHHFSQSWSHEHVEAKLINSINSSPSDCRPTHVWLEYVSNQKGYERSAIHLTPYISNINSISTLHKKLFDKNGQIPIEDIELIDSLGSIKHISRLDRNNKLTFKLHVKTTPEQLTQILFSLGWNGDFDQLVSIFDSIGECNLSMLQKCLFADISFTQGEIDSKIGLYLSNKETPQVNNKQMYELFSALSLKLPLDMQKRDKFIKLLNNDSNLPITCDLKIVVNEELVETKAYFCIQKDHNDELCHLKKQLTKAFPR